MSMGNADGMDGMDWSFLGTDPASPQPFNGIIPAGGTSSTPSLIPVPPLQDQSAALVPLSAYAPAPILQDPSAGISPDNGTPSPRGVANALDAAGYFPEGAAIFAKNVARLGGGDQSALEALGKTTPYLTMPLAIGSAISGSVADIQQNGNPVDAIVGNGLRTAVTLSGAAAVGGLAGLGVGYILNRHLPNGAAMGKAFLEPVPNDGLLYAAPLSPDQE